VVKENELPSDRYQHLLKDGVIELTGIDTKEKHPEPLRRVAVWDGKDKQAIEPITDRMSWTANTISELYKARWQVRIFFREIKQLLHIESFIGTSENAVMIQIWTAFITILALKALKAMTGHKWCLSNLVAFMRSNLFVKVDLKKRLGQPFDRGHPPPQKELQGVLF